MRLGIAEVPIEITANGEFRCRLAAPATVRAIAFGEKQQRVVTANPMPPQPMLVLFAECCPDADPVAREYVLLPSNRAYTPNEGLSLSYRASAQAPTGQMFHLYEVTRDHAGDGQEVASA
jgi:hypothetical protein